MTSYQTDCRKSIWLAGIVAFLAASMLMGCSSGGSDASVPEDLSNLIQKSGILISSTDTIPTKRIVEFHNLVMVSHTSTSPQGTIKRSMTAFVAKVRASGANAVIDFKISLVSSSTPQLTTLLHGMAVVVE